MCTPTPHADIANQLRAQDKDKGITRLGGDYYADAAKPIYSERTKVFQALGRRGRKLSTFVSDKR